MRSQVLRFLLISCYINFIMCDVIIQESGVRPIEENDMALIFFLTLQNVGDNDYEIVVSMQECCLDSKGEGKDCSSMSLIGGNMGILKSKTNQNVTLLYPNLYLYNRKGTCSISIKYRNQHGTKEIIRDVCFHTEFKSEKTKYCNTEDLDQMDGCSPQDCTIKYSGNKNFFNHECNKCEKVPKCFSSSTDCLPDVAYSVISNQCKDLNRSVTKDDLEELEKMQVMTNYKYNIKNHIVCHHGSIDTDDMCNCFEDWRTTIDDVDDYTPRLAFYHMCNIQVGSWNTVNRSKLEATALVIAIFAITITSKILILMCFLNWCYKYAKKNNDSYHDPHVLREDVLTSKCTCNKSVAASIHKNTTDNKNLKAETVHVDFYPCGACPKDSSDKTKFSSSKSSTKTTNTKKLRFCVTPQDSQSYVCTTSSMASYSCRCASPSLVTDFSKISEDFNGNEDNDDDDDDDDEFEIEFSNNESEEEESLSESDSNQQTTTETGFDSLETESDQKINTHFKRNSI